MLPNITVSKEGDAWAVRREGTEVVINKHGSLDDALGVARKLAKQGGVDLVWEAEDGQTHRESHEQESGASTEGTVSAQAQH